MMKMYFKKQGLKVLSYTDYKMKNFRQGVFARLREKYIKIDQLAQFLNILKKVFDVHAPIKKRYIRTVQGPFRNKTLQKIVMARSRLRNKFLKNKRQSKESAYKK